MSEIVAAGARRVSVGSWLTMVAVDAVAEAAKEMRDTGDFSSLTARPPRSTSGSARADLVPVAGDFGEPAVQPVA